jgi:large repetitive protein
MPHSKRTLLFSLALLLLMSTFTLAPTTAQSIEQRSYAPRAIGFLAPKNLKASQNGGDFQYLPTNDVSIRPTSLDFGPDDRLYVTTHKGWIYAYTIARDNAANTFYITATEEIGVIRSIPNYNDDGTPFIPAVGTANERQVTGILVVGTYDKPVIYVTSSDPRSTNPGSGPLLGDVDLDTNSGIVSRLTRTNSGQWEMVHLVRGLPRSEEYHSTNGVALDPITNTLYVTSGGNTNMGAPGKNFAYTPEYALSAALLSVNLNMIDAMPVLTDSYGHKYIYDLPTIDDPTRPGNPDNNDPFGGNDGLNQAMIVPNGPVQIYSPGYRNIYDVVLTENTRRLYVFDNGPNQNWGGSVNAEGIGTCTNLPKDTGSATYYDQLHYIIGQGYYAGHVNPVRGNPAGARLYRYTRNNEGQEVLSQEYDFTADWSPVPFNMANPVECDHLPSGTNADTNDPAADNSLSRVNGSTNGMTEYTGSNFGNAMKGNLLAASYDGKIYRLALNAAGTAVTTKDSAMSNFGTRPLDVTAQGDTGIFPGTVWAVTYVTGKITIFEPTDFVECLGTDDSSKDEDLDGYNNADELDAGANPCSGGNRPADWDNDFVSDFNDADDDNDTTPDLTDAFAIDSQNGTNVTLPLYYPFVDSNPGKGFYGIGFTGLMTNGSTDYLTMYDDNNLTAGGAAGAFTIDVVSGGDATGAFNTQQNAFQFGVNVSTATSSFSVESRMVSPFFNGITPVNGQSQGMYIGTGDQQNYLKIALDSNNGIVVTREINDSPTYFSFNMGALLSADFIDLGFIVDTNASTALPRVRINNSTWQVLGTPISIPSVWLSPNDNRGLAMGVIATSGASGVTFPATWDYFAAEHVTIEATATPTSTVDATATAVTQTLTPVSTEATATTAATQTAAGTTSTPEGTPTNEVPTPTPTEHTGVELLVNGGFEDTGLNPWKLKRGTADKIKCNKPDKTIAFEGQCTFQFKGSVGEKAKLEQTLDGGSITFNVGDTITLTGVFEAKKSAASGKIKVKIKYGDGTPNDTITVSIEQVASYQPFTESKTLASGSISKIKVSVNHRSTSGKVLVDGVSLKLNSTTTIGLLPLP